MRRPRERGRTDTCATDERGAIRSFLVCDDPAARAKLRTALAAYGDIDVVGDGASGSQPLDQIEAAAADVVVIDCDLRVEQLAELCRSLKACRASVSLLLLTTMRRPPLRLAIDIADGLMLRSTPAPVLAQGIRNAHRGRPAVDRHLWPALFGDELAC